MLRTSLTSQAIDDVLAGSFPASDPPAWTPGIARPAPELATRPQSPAPRRARPIRTMRQTRSMCRGQPIQSAHSYRRSCRWSEPPVSRCWSR